MSEESYQHKYDKLRERIKDLRQDIIQQEDEIEKLKKENEQLELIIIGCPNCYQKIKIPTTDTDSESES
jgi:predicted  nucleic acid-binding Zn-ribbon protein